MLARHKEMYTHVGFDLMTICVQKKLLTQWAELFYCWIVNLQYQNIILTAHLWDSKFVQWESRPY